MDIIKILVSNGFLQIIVTATISYVVAKVQSNSNSRNIDKQIEGEISKLAKQYEYEQKRDNTNYLNKLIL